MDEIEEFDWGFGDSPGSSRRESQVREAEAKELSARLFVTYIEEHAIDKMQLKKALKEIYQELEYNTTVSLKYGIVKAIPKPHECAQQAGYITIENTRPYTFTIIDQKKDKIALRPYQIHIIEEVSAQKGSVLVEAPTGSGKSIMACEIAKAEIEKEGRVLIVAPKLILLEQLKETFSELNPQIIHGAQDYDKSHTVFISTIQTAHKRDLGFEPTMILIDEVHFGFTGTMIETLLRDFKGRLIGLSATPYDKHGLPLKGFDKHLDRYDLRYMLKHGFLVPPFCFAPVKADLSKIGIVAGDYNQGELDVAFNNLENVMQIVKTTKEKVLERKATLVFCINIAHSELMAQGYREEGVNARAIHSKLSQQEQDGIMHAYRNGEIKVLTNPVMLTTGFDDPATDCIILARATKSQNLYRQMVGRGLRLFENKDDAVILDCAGVINDLGLPTDPIKPRLQLSTNVQAICSACGSKNLFRKVKDNQAMMVCADCGDYDYVKPTGVECEACGLVHGNDAKFVSEKEVLYLVCDKCGHHTLVSSTSSQEELQEIFDENFVKDMQTKFAVEYIEHLFSKSNDVMLPFQEEVAMHIRAFLKYIEQHPTEFVGTIIERLKYENEVFKDSLEGDYEEVQDEEERFEWFVPWKWEHDGRLFGMKLEEELLNEDVAPLKTALQSSESLLDSIRLINRLLDLRKREPLSDAAAKTLIEHIEKSSVPNIEQMCNKRLKDLYERGDDINEINGFVALMESVF